MHLRVWLTMLFGAWGHSHKCHLNDAQLRLWPESFLCRACKVFFGYPQKIPLILKYISRYKTVGHITNPPSSAQLEIR